MNYYVLILRLGLYFGVPYQWLLQLRYATVQIPKELQENYPNHLTFYVKIWHINQHIERRNKFQLVTNIRFFAVLKFFLMQLSFCKRNGQARTQKGGLPGCKAPSNQNLKDTDFVKTAIYLILRDLPAAKTSNWNRLKVVTLQFWKIKQ